MNTKRDSRIMSAILPGSRAARFLVVLLALSTVVLSLPAQPSNTAGEKPRITEAAFLTLFKSGRGVINRKVPATAILATLAWARTNEGRAKLGEFQSLSLSDCIVDGDLDLSGQTVPLSFVVHETTFLNRVLFKNTVFTDSVNISGVTFRSVVVFAGAIFKSSVDFSGDKYESYTSFENSTFKYETTFYDQTFEHLAVFTRAIFERMVQFSSNSFQDDADFSQVVFQGSVRFERSEFGGLASFRDLNISQSASFVVTTFAKDAFFDQLKGETLATLEFFGVSFKGRSYFDNSRVANLRFSTRFSDREISEMAGPADSPTNASAEFARRFYSPTVFEKLAVFRGLRSERVDFTEAEFQDQVDFIGAHFGTLARFLDTTFKGEVNFLGADFPSREKVLASTTSRPDKGLVLDGAHFRDRVMLNWAQLVEDKGWWGPCGSQLKVATSNPTTWYALEEVFRRSGNLYGQNEALYQRRQLSRNEAGGIDESRYSNYVAWLFWGYGVRPLRLVLWMIMIFVLFTWLYWTQTPGGGLRRLRAAMHFSARNSWKLNYGYERALTPSFKIATLAHSLTSKVMGLFLLQVFANVSPLLNSILGKLLPM